MAIFGSSVRTHLYSAIVCGAFFASPASAADETVLYSFRGGTDGAYPVAGPTFMGGMLYGTTSSGGTSSLSFGAGCDYVGTGCGVVYSASLEGSETVLHSFQGSDGNTGSVPDYVALPLSGLTRVGDILYGTSYWGGIPGSPCDWGCGTLYSVTAQGALTILRSFTRIDGAYPESGVVQFGNLLVGSTSVGGGSTGSGVVFATQLNGSAQRVLHAFAQDHTDGAFPAGTLIRVGGVLYGTTTQGGEYGHGTVYRVSSAGTEVVIYAFKGGADGDAPVGLTSVGGVLYGTTTYGGLSACHGGCGMAYAMTTQGVKTVLHAFSGGKDGANPNGSLVELGGRFFGTTINGGAYNRGTAFSVGRDGSLTIEHAFRGGTDGANPRGAMIAVGGKLYGTTYFGGLGTGCNPGNAGGGCGTLFSIKP